MEKQPEIKNFMTDKMLGNIVNELNELLKAVNLEIDKKYRPATENDKKDRQNTDIGNYLPTEHMTLFIVWNRKVQSTDENGIKFEETEKYRVGQIILDQFYTHVRLNLPENYQSGISLFSFKLSNDMIYKRLQTLVPRALLYHMHKEYGEEYLKELSRYIKVLTELKNEGKSPVWYDERVFMNARMGQLMDDINDTKDLYPQTLFDLEKALLLITHRSLEHHIL